jgi:large subunit ribosomal protein L25
MSVILTAEKRENFGTAAARRIKKENKIPAIIYSKNSKNINLSLGVKEFEREYFKGIALSSVVELELEGKKIKVIAHKVEVDPVSDRPIHVDFFNCEDAKTIRAKPKLVFTNQDKSPGLKKGGFLHIVLRRVEVICEDEKSVLDKIEVDVSRLQVTQKIRASNLILPQGVKLAKKDDFLIASIIGRGKAEEEVPVAGAASPAAGAASPAAGAASPAKAADKKTEKKPEKK